MTKLDDFNKIYHNDNEIGKVLHQGKTIWQKEPDVYLAQDSDFVNVDGNWVYKGTSKWVEIPTHINGKLVTSTFRMFDGSLMYDATPVTKVVLKHSYVTNMSYMFQDSTATTLDLSSFNTSNVTNMSYMFVYSKATTLDLSSFNTSNVTDMRLMFSGSSATSLDLSSFDTSKVTYASNMFASSRATTGYARTQADANKFNATSGKPAGLKFVVKPYLAQDSDFVKVEGYWVYRGAALEVEIPTHINGQLVTSTQYMFGEISPYLATPVTKVVLKHSNVTNMANMFNSSSATTLDLSNFNTSNVTNMGAMFPNSRATTLDLSGFDTSNVTNMVAMFMNSIATIGYARTQTDADKLNASAYKPKGLNFVVK